MAKYQLKTFKDLVDAIMEQLKLQSTDVVSRNRIKRNVNFVYLNEVVPYKRWTWMRNSIDIQHQAYINTGTASVTSGSQTVTLSSALGFSRKGFSFSVEGSNEIYRIQSHVANSAVLQLEIPYAGSTLATARFRIWSEAVPLPSDCQEVVEVRRDTSVRPLDAMSLQEIRRIQTIRPKAEGYPGYYTVTDFRTPSAYETISGLPAVSTRQSDGLTKTVVFASSLGATGSTLLLPGDRIEITNAGEKTYNGEWKVAAVSTTNTANDTITFTGLLPLQEVSTADPSVVVKIEASESDARYREMLIYPSISNLRVNLHVDYSRSIEPMVNDDDEPKMPIEDRVILFYGGLAWSWNRERNPEEFSNAFQLFQRKLDRMAGKTEDQPEKPLLAMSLEYLRTKRSNTRFRTYLEGGNAGGGGGGGAGVITGTPASVAIFGSTGELESSPNISTTELGYLNNATSNIQAQIDGLNALSSGTIWVGNSSNVKQERAVTGDISLSNTGVASIAAGAVVNADISASAAIDASKIADGSVSNTQFQYINSLTSNAQTQITAAQNAATAAQVNIDVHEALSAGVHGVTGSVVGTTDIQTLSAKTIELLTTNVQVDSTSTGSDQDLAAATGTLRILTNASLTSVRSLASPSATRFLLLKNDTGASITIRNQAGAATAANRIITGTGADLIVKDDTTIALVYDTNASRWQVFGGAGAGGAYEVSGSRASPTGITAAGGITSTANQRQILFVQGSGGAVTITASPAISAGTTVGQELTLIGRSDTNTLTVPHQASAVELNGDCTLGAGDMLNLIWDGTAWVESSRT